MNLVTDIKPKDFTKYLALYKTKDNMFRIEVLKKTCKIYFKDITPYTYGKQYNYKKELDLTSKFNTYFQELDIKYSKKGLFVTLKMNNIKDITNIIEDFYDSYNLVNFTKEQQLKYNSDYKNHIDNFISLYQNLNEKEDAYFDDIKNNYKKLSTNLNALIYQETKCPTFNNKIILEVEKWTYKDLCSIEKVNGKSWVRCTNKLRNKVYQNQYAKKDYSMYSYLTKTTTTSDIEDIINEYINQSQDFKKICKTLI